MSDPTHFHSIPDALEDIRNGKVVIVLDDEDRENEGDFFCAAEKLTSETTNFILAEGRGLMVAPITTLRCKELDLPLMVPRATTAPGTPSNECAFTVSVDVRRRGCTTGISAHDRTQTVLALVDRSAQPSDFARPGHMFPLMARAGGVLERRGHTEAAVDLARLAGLTPAGVLVEILNKDGSMARRDDLIKLSTELHLKIISIEELVKYRASADR